VEGDVAPFADRVIMMPNVAKGLEQLLLERGAAEAT